MAIYKNTPPIVTNGLVLSLDAANVKSYPKTGTTWSDLSGNRINGTFTNGPTFSSDGGGSILFDGVNDHLTTNGVSIPTNSNVTFCTFLKINNWGSGANPGLWRSDTNSGGTYFNIFSSNTGRPWVRWNNTEILRPTTGYQTPLNEWIYITFVINSATNVLYYVNGDLKYSALHSRPTSAFTIYNFNIQYSVAEGLGANYSNIHLYTRDLNVTEILQNYNALKSRFGL